MKILDSLFRQTLTLAGIFVVAAADLPAADPNEFEVFSYDLIQGNNTGVDLPGRLYVPENYDPSGSYKFVVFLHGAGEGGTNNTSQVNSIIDPLLASAKANGFFLYAPQAPGAAWADLDVDRTMLMVANAVRDYAIDPSSIYVMGYSAGGRGTWATASRYASAVAAAVPIAAPNYLYADFNRLVDVPIWAHHARDDATVSKSSSRNQVNKVRAANGLPALSFPPDSDTTTTYYHEESKLRYTEYPTGGHGISSRVLSNSTVTSWMLSQTKDPTASALHQGERVLLDFGASRPTYNTTNRSYDPDSHGLYWNSTSADQVTTPGTAIAFAHTDTGHLTGVIVDVADTFRVATSSGVPGSPLFDNGIGTDGWLTNLNAVGTILIRGLTPGGNYALEIFASHNTDDGGRGRMTRYQVDGLFQDLEGYNNLDNLAKFESVQADSRGWIELDVMPTPGSTSRYGLINTLAITAIPEPSLLTLLGVGGAVLLSARRRNPAG